MIKLLNLFINFLRKFDAKYAHVVQTFVLLLINVNKGIFYSLARVTLSVFFF